MKTVEIPENVIFKCKNYCNHCGHMELEVEDGEEVYGGNIVTTITPIKIKCIHYEACLRLHDKLTREEGSY